MPTTAPWFVLPVKPKTCEPVIILGAGLAGCHTAYELATRNIKVLLIDASHCIAGGASANPAGIVKPFVTKISDPATQFHKDAFDYLVDRLDSNSALREHAQFNTCGVLQLVDKTYPSNPLYENCSPQQASDIAGTSIKNDAIYFARGGTLNPQALCQYLSKHPNIDVQLNTSVQKLSYSNAQWHLTLNTTTQTLPDTNKKTLICNTLILANGEHINHFEQTQPLPITCARGQTSGFKKTSANELKTAVTGKHYAIALDDTVLVGATYKRDDNNKTPRKSDHDKNFIALQNLLPELDAQNKIMSEFCGIRATTPDRLPIVGPVPDFMLYQHDYSLIKNGLPNDQFPNAGYQPNLYVIGGFGSRGIVCAPYCSMLLAEQISKSTGTTPIPVSQDDLERSHTLLHPGRFAIRALRRGQPLL